MNIISNLYIDRFGLVFSLIVALFILAGYFLNLSYKPSFVIPFARVIKLKYFFQKIIIGILMISILLLPLNISFLVGKSVQTQRNLNIQILFDVSLSMTADDIKPSRFSSAKSSVIDLVKNLSGYNTSIITFSGLPFIWAPFTSQTDALISKLNDMKLGDFPPTLNFVGTAIGDALVLGTSNLLKYPNRDTTKVPGVIILITDGDSNKGSEPLQATQIAANNKIPVYTLGIGKNNYVVGYDHYGSPVTTDINIDLLKSIASIANGKFYRVLSENDFKGIFDEIAKYIKSSEVTTVQNQYFYINYYIYQVIVLCLIVLLAIRGYILFSERRKIGV